MTKLVVMLIVAACLLFASEPGLVRQESAGPQESDWKAAMAGVLARFQGRPGTFAHFGDSITDTRAFWTPLRYRRKAAPPEMERAYRRVEAYLRPECWRDWKGPEH